MLIEFILKESDPYEQDRNRANSFENVFLENNSKESAYWHDVFVKQFLMPKIKDGWIKLTNINDVKKYMPALEKTITLSNADNNEMILYTFPRFWVFGINVKAEWKYYLVPMTFIDPFKLFFYKTQNQKMSEET